MSEFLELLPPLDALERFLSQLPATPEPEVVKTADAARRVTFEPVRAPHDLPGFARSTVDGYAVRAADTHGAGESLPAYLEVVGEVPMGGTAPFEVGRGQCGLIHTGGMLPAGADAVVMVEVTQAARPGELEVLRAVAVGENVIKVGEDVRAGDEVIAGGTQLRPAEIGGLMALGLTRVNVARRPRVAILSSGDEVVAPEMALQPGQVRDVNSYTLQALVEAVGGQPVCYPIIPDRAEAFEAAARQALGETNMVVFTAGSSVSVRDLTARTINELGRPGVLVHGVSVRPGKPTILAVCQGKAVVGLPGNPVSALIIADLFVRPVIEKHLGLRRSQPRPSVQARLSLNLSSQAGREDWVPVRLEVEGESYRAEPVFGKSNLIFTLVQADGLVRIAPQANGLEANEVVRVYLL